LEAQVLGLCIACAVQLSGVRECNVLDVAVRVLGQNDSLQGPVAAARVCADVLENADEVVNTVVVEVADLVTGGRLGRFLHGVELLRGQEAVFFFGVVVFYGTAVLAA
jgi:hypothetical protein